MTKCTSRACRPSLTRLGRMLAKGEGVAKDMEEARNRLQTAARLGDKEAEEALRQITKEK